MLLSKIFKRTGKIIVEYTESEIANISDMYLANNDSTLSPTINSILQDIRNYNKGDATATKNLRDKNINPESYLEDLAKVNIFISKTVKCPDDFTKEMLIESAFASFQYQKENNLSFDTFDKFFSTEDGHPFESFNEIVVTKKKPLSKDTNGMCRGNVMYLNSDMNFEEYSLSLEKTLTHELQHIVSGNGTYEKHPFLGKISSKITGLNEMCTEWNAEQIIHKFLDPNNYVRAKDTLVPMDDLNNKKSKSKVLSFVTCAKDYKEMVSFYDSIDVMLGGKLKDLYYNRDSSLPILLKGPLSKDESKLISDIYDFSQKAYWDLTKDRGSSYKNHIIPEERFDAMIDSFTSLSTRYVKEVIKLDHKPDTTVKEDAECLNKLKAFFDTFDNINFKKEGDKLVYSEQIKQRILKSIFENENTLNDILSLTKKPAPATTSSATTSSSVSTPTATKTIPEDSISFTLEINESKLKENCEALGINCSISQVNEFFNNLATDNGFNKSDTGSFYKEGASTEDIESLVREFLNDKSYLNGCVESITVKDKDTSYTITDFSSAQEIRQKEMKNSLEKNKNIDKPKSVDTDLEL